MKIARWFFASVALAAAILGGALAHGQGVDPVQRFLQEGVDQYEAGLKAFGSGDYQSAMQHWLPLAKIGSVDAQNNLGYLYANGLGVTQDYEEARQWYRRSADQGNAIGQHNLGLMYAKGVGVAQDHEEALKWYRLSAEQRYPEAVRSLGIAHHYGRGVKQDFVEAYKWFRAAADLGHPNASQSAALVARRLSAEDVDQGRELARLWVNARTN